MKQKRKAQPTNFKRYWVTFSLLALLLLLPFRFVEHWEITRNTYLAVGAFILLLFVRFAWRYGWRQRVTLLMLLCFSLTFMQTFLTYNYESCFFNSAEHVRCNNITCGIEMDFVVVRGTSFGIQTMLFPNEILHCTPEVFSGLK